MPLDLEQHILKVLRGMSSGDRPATINDLSRALGINPPVIRDCITEMVERGTAQPSMVSIKGVSTLHGLMGQPKKAPEAAPAPEAAVSS